MTNVIPFPKVDFVRQALEGARRRHRTSAGGDSGMSTSDGSAELTEHESHVLALISREQPTTAYKIRRIIAESPTSGISSSSGAVYPIVNRLKDKGLLTTASVANDGRNTELLLVTKDGRAAIRRWVKAIKPSQLLPDDPIRTRISHSDFLTAEERAVWLGKLRVELEAKLVEIDDYMKDYPTGAIIHAHRHARMMTRARIAWIDETIAIDREAGALDGREAGSAVARLEPRRKQGG